MTQRSIFITGGGSGIGRATAQRLYARLGFCFAYRYHYRSDNPAAVD